MATKDPHIALIDAHEALDQVKISVRQAMTLMRRKLAAAGRLTDDDKLMIKSIRQQAIDNTRRIQEQLLNELESHGKLS